MNRLAITLALLPFAAWANEDDIFLQGIAPESENVEKTPLFVVPLQPVWNSADADLLLKVGKNMVTLIEEAGPWKVTFYDETKALRKVQDHEKRLYKKWMKEVVYTEALLRHRRAGHATSGAERVLRLQAQNAGYLRTPDLYCRSLAIVAEGRLFMGQVGKAKKVIKRLAGTCERGDLEKSRLVLSERFEALLVEASAAAKREATAELTITTDVPGTEVFLNGRSLGSAPLIIKGVPTGKHLIGVFREGYKPWGKKVTLDDGQSLSVAATVTRGSGGQDQQQMLATLRDNRIDANVARVVGRLFKRHGKKAALGIFGGVAQQKNEIWVTLYAVDRKGRAKRLKQMKFDSDFLTAHLTLGPLMEELEVIAKDFEGELLAQAMLLDGLKPVTTKPRALKWRVIGAEAEDAVGERLVRGPVRRLRTAGARRAAAAERARSEAPASVRAQAPASAPEAPIFAAKKEPKKPKKPDPVAASKPAPEPPPQAVPQPLPVDLEDEEESLAAEMEALAVQEASEATGMSVADLQARAERDMRERIWKAMEPDLLLEVDALLSAGLGAAGNAGALQFGFLRRQPLSKVGLWGGYGVEVFGGVLPVGMKNPLEFAVLEHPFKESTRADPKLQERVRAVTGSSLGLRAIGRLGLDLRQGSLRVIAQGGLGWARHSAKLTHEQYAIDDEGRELEGSAIAIRDSIGFPWQGLELSLVTGVSHRLARTKWRVNGKLQWQRTILGTVNSFVSAAGDQSTAGLLVGVSGTF